MDAKILRILKRRSRSVLLLSYFRNHNIEFSKKVGVTCSRGTYNRYGIVCAHLADFIREVYGRKDMDFSDITLKTINDFDVYLRKTVKLKPNSVWVYMTTSPLGILEKYNVTSKGEAVFRVPCNAYCNMMLVKIMENAGIHRKITFHSGLLF